jgi:ribonuclease P protein subunit RPR2
MARRRNKSEERDIAQRRIDRLLALARAEARVDPARSDRYGGLVLRVAQRYQTGLSPQAKAQVCRKCGAYRSAASSRTRLQGKRLVTTCLRCGDIRRRPLSPKEVTP